MPFSFDTLILNDGNNYPALAFGTGSKWKGRDVADYVEQAFDAGFSHIDTAARYANEASVGVAIKQSGLSRSEIYITTKYILGSVEGSIKSSLTKLGLEQVDMYLIHEPKFAVNLESTWRDFEQVKKTGQAKSIGVSNFNLSTLQKLVKIAHIKPAVNQIFFNPYNYSENKDLLEYSARHGIVTEAYSALTPITRYPGGPVDAPVNAAAKRLNATPAQVILSWVRSKGVAIVTTSSSREHLEEYLSVAELPSLTEEEISAIDQAGSRGPPLSTCHRKLLVTGVLASVTFILTRRYLW